ncbi:MAG: 16S rRNA (cytosine(1402)-N(4))-methyltransferase [Anaerolineae bacterium UTCFX2]|jgi:16S rRNA (cytosine1402-N4)-methyltransferase|nr:16S rRNA (cytosine(1402)-N(4))-methyltransferase RsmH [Anaerolineae bacterium]MCZ7551219.1 16S rRNA (cytosine(1402)-N(4))-methyltransferase RsmH [Anaerolineales bacterium]OQY94478.1 MAG: 16S rRNA (cytosine(1402)-N(4))-methyltransferase [Anaerolineae bacterium UTCFX2]
MTSLLDDAPHRPVLYNEIIQFLQPKPGGRYVDCTLGAGGHAWGILEHSSPDGVLLGLEVDPLALDIARQRLKLFEERVCLVQESYVTLSEQLDNLGWLTVDGILLDLGVSSMQLDIPERGFSFLMNGPLDMRFDPEAPVRAFDLVNGLSVDELADIIYRFSEEPHARRIARAIVQSRPVNSTFELAEIVKRTGQSSRSRGPVEKRTHSATRTFQALRIAVNHELESLEKVLPQAINRLAEGGRLAVIAFHSLEDRIVKQTFRQESKGCICPPRQPFCTCGHKASIAQITPRPIRPTEGEIRCNPRGRSARLRVVEKLPASM